MDKQKGFTLSETILAIVILGIIAAITVPSIIENYNRRTTVTKVKRFYSDLTNAYNQFIISNNNIAPETSSYPKTIAGATKLYQDIFEPYFQIKYNAGTNTENKQSSPYDESSTELSLEQASKKIV